MALLRCEWQGKQALGDCVGAGDALHRPKFATTLADLFAELAFLRHKWFGHAADAPSARESRRRMEIPQGAPRAAPERNTGHRMPAGKLESSADNDARETTLNPWFKWERSLAFGLSATRADLHSGLPLHPRGRN